MDSFDLQEEVQSLQDIANIDIPNEQDVPSMDSRTVSQLLEKAVEALANSSDAITQPHIYDAYRSLLKHSESLQGTTMSKLLDSITSAFQSHIDQTLTDVEQEDQQVFMSHKLPHKKAKLFGN